ncbi:hypothetical protein [Streptomyces griseofuscus]|uniref:hypothetical protein n=1 Tax=Streptomyces griseofuscus TaxID=146922 RepID=UPI0033C90945
MPKFQITTTSGLTYVEGSTRHFEVFDTTETLTDYDHTGDYVELRYSGGIEVAIPEVQIAEIVTA